MGSKEMGKIKRILLVITGLKLQNLLLIERQ